MTKDHGSTRPHRVSAAWPSRTALSRKPALQPNGMQPTTSATLDPNKSIVITGGKLLTITHGTIENGVLVI